MPEFVTYQSQRNRSRDTSATVRLAALDDVGAIASILVTSSGEDEHAHLAGASREIAEQNGVKPMRMVFVAEEEGKVVGFGRVGYLSPPETAPDNCIPDGWYLNGLIVKPDQRNRGIAALLTESRLDALADRTMIVRYFANSLNRVSMELHRKLGFLEVSRGIWVPKGKFSGDGIGILYELRFDRRVSRKEGRAD